MYGNVKRRQKLHASIIELPHSPNNNSLKIYRYHSVIQTIIV